MSTWAPWVIWIAWAVIGIGLEANGLRKQNDRWEPLTVYVRALMRYSWLFRAFVLAFCTWLLLHFAAGID